MIPRAPALMVLLVATAACSQSAAPPQSSPSPAATAESPTAAPSAEPPLVSRRFARIACSLPREQIQRVYNGYHPIRSGEIQFVPAEPDYVGNFASHSGPWDYLARVPLFLYGPGHVPEVGRVGRKVTVADIAPTFAEHLDFDFEAPDGEPLNEAIDPAADPPRLILTMVWDAGGRDVLDAYPRSWPVMRRLIPRGVWYENAEVGSSPSVTPAIHSSIGTGALPRNHGVVDLRFRIAGNVDPSAYQRATLLIGPTLADAYDVELGNEPVIGMVGAEGTLGMIGHGALWEGGDMDLAGAQRAGEWGLALTNQQYYALPDYIPDHPGYEEVEPNADREDGTVDGRWYGLELDNPDSLTLTPSYADYQTDVIETIIEREGFGRDEITDLLYVNYKQIDKVGHKFAFPSVQMEAAVEGSDEELGDLIEMLDREVGKGEWVIAVTADHGATPRPETTGAFVIDNFELQRDLQAEFDPDDDSRPVFQNPRVTQSWIDLEEMEEHGYTLEDISDFLMTYTRAENAGGAALPEDPEEPAFTAAFPSAVMDDLPCLRYTDD
ncbi:MAG: alkaline phosphatase family protein [Actinomycetota bacterium]